MRQEKMFEEYVIQNPKRYAVNLVNVRLVKEKRIGYLDERVITPEIAVKIAMNLLEGADREHFLTIFVDVNNKINGVQITSIGSMYMASVTPREVFKGAILANAAAVICVHNHPSGNLAPSEADKSACQILVRAGEIIMIPVLDFIIVGPEGDFFSFKEHGYFFKVNENAV